MYSPSSLLSLSLEELDLLLIRLCSRIDADSKGVLHDVCLLLVPLNKLDETIDALSEMEGVVIGVMTMEEVDDDILGSVRGATTEVLLLLLLKSI